MRLPTTTSVTLRLAASLMCAASAFASRAQSGPDLTAAMRALHEAREVCDWEAVVERARAARAVAPRGSTPWFEACAHEVTALYQLWRPEELELTARDALSAADDMRRANPDARNSGIGPLDPFSAGCVTLIRNDLARVLQSRGLHSEALGHLRLMLDDLYAGPVGEASAHIAKAGLDVGRGLMALGRSRAAQESLISLRDSFPRAAEGVVASAILQSGVDGLDAYRGKYQGDAVQRRRMQEFLAAIPGARRTLAQRLGSKEEDLPHPPIGFADGLPGLEDLGGVTTGDARRPEFLPAVVIFSESLALRILEDDVVLVHELAHVVQMRAFGPAHDRLPAWIHEGFCEVLAGQIDGSVDRLLASHLGTDPGRFIEPAYTWEKALAFGSEPCTNAGTQASGLSFLLLLDRYGLDGLRRLFGAFSNRRSADDAFREVTGMAAEQYLQAAGERAEELLEERRRAIVPRIGAIVQARERGNSAALEQAERALARDLPPPARAFAAWERAKALLGLGRLDEALSALDGLLEARPRYPLFLEEALRGKASCLLALHRSEEARALLNEIRRNVRTRELVQWAEQRLAEIGGVQRR